MASLTAQVNRRLASARVILTELAAVPERPPFAEQALLEAGLFHLRCGYTHYLRELCAYYGVKYVAAINTEAEARKALELLDKQPAELAELRQLAERPDSWVSQVVAGYRSCWVSDSAVAAPEIVAGAAPNNLIPTQRLDDVVQVQLTRSSLAEWLDEAQTLIMRHRQSSTEC
ncbi:DUF6586 family protein [Gilvimarinus polysaccharolyticus]|uniref:DUF6586 family protein n=1 Tax=Gilvimarinus polysaccharolyticus TaxID=863921 RepID=UPI00067320BC|nr:DUF6586 family protein [Gilvimarinus polysaccharolyticus]